MLMAIGGAMIAVYLPDRIRGWALGMLSTFAAICVATGPVLGGYLTEYLSWHWIFLVNIPVGIGAVLLGMTVIPRDRPRKVSLASFDAPGAGLLFVTLGSLIFTISLGRVFGYTSPVILSTAAMSAIGAAAFLFRESRMPEPLVSLPLFKNRRYTFGNLGLLCMFIIYSGTSFLLPFYFEQGRGFLPDITGLFMLVPAGALVGTAVFAGRASDRIGSRIPCIAAGFCFIGAMYLFSTITLTTDIRMIVLILILFGCAVGLFVAPNFRLLMSHAPRGGEGVISSIAMTVRNIGSAIGVATFSMVFVLVSGKGSADSVMTTVQRDAGFRAAFLFGFAVTFVILVSAFLSHEKEW
jgi:MFS family permease